MACSGVMIFCCLLLLCPVQGEYFQTLRQRKSAEDDILEPIWKHILTMPATPGERGLATPMFWHIHKSGGSTVHDVLGSCLNLTVASHIGVDHGHGADQSLAFSYIYGAYYLNVDTTSEKGIQRAHAMGFHTRPKLVQLVLSPLIRYATELLFSDENKGSIFTFLRHPVERAASLFYYLQNATWEPTFNSIWASMTLLEYAQSPYAERNWMVQMLVGKTSDMIDEHDLEEAKKILRNKIWVGLQDRMHESLVRLGAVYGWNQFPKWEVCLKEVQEGKWMSNKNHNKPVVTRESEAWDLLAQINHLDMKLFHFAESLFDQQDELVYSAI